MIIVLKPDASEREVDHIIDRLRELGLKSHMSTGQERTIIGVIGDDRILHNQPLTALAGVESVLPILAPWKLVSREFKKENTIIDVNGVKIGDKKITIMAGPSWTQTRRLLTGAIVAAGCGALVALLLTVAPEHKLRGMLFWLMGDLSHATDPWPTLVALAGMLISAMPFVREVNLLLRGGDTAQALGVAVGRLRRVVYFLAVRLATAIAVTSAGSIGSVGLIVPHLVRLAVGNAQRLLLPAATLVGGSLLVLADTLARTMVAPQQLPVGVLTALLGVPAFLFLLSRGGHRS